MIDVDWVEGQPDGLKAGMIVMWSSGDCSLVGHIDEQMNVPSWEYDGQVDSLMVDIQRWAWLVKPHELEWIEAIGARKT